MPTYALKSISELLPAGYNPRQISEKELDKLKASIELHGFVEPVVINADNTIIGGHQRIKAAIAMGMTEVPVMQVDIPKEQEKALNLALNRISGEWDDEKLAALILSLDEETRKQTGFDDDEISKILEKAGEEEEKKELLSERFLVPPMSILDSRLSYWQDRKRKWLSFGIESEVGRNDNLLNFSDTILQPDEAKREENAQAGKKDDALIGTSIFDPVLCELVYRWFVPKEGKVLDPFAGGSVRGIVASLLNLEYTGIELRAEQVEANSIQAGKILLDRPDNLSPLWINGDSRHELHDLPETDTFDFIFSCPPYADLEKYSDDPADISAMAYPEFLASYREIIASSCARLRDNRFAAFVVGDVRDKDGNYRNFVSETIRAFLDAGLTLYNEAIFITAYASLPMRVGKQFDGSRKMGKTHQNLLVFQKGKPEESCELMAPYFEEHRQLGEHHQKLLVFAKGNAKAATNDLGPVLVDNESFVLNSETELS